MGVLFVNKDYKTILDKSEGRAGLFINLTRVAADFYKLPVPLTEVISDASWVNEEQFCQIVEAAFADPIVFLCPWAQYAAGMYEVIKGERYEWEWDAREMPLQPFQPLRQVSLAPEKSSGKVIGPRRAN